jgi:hypothetical protein
MTDHTIVTPSPAADHFTALLTSKLSPTFAKATARLPRVWLHSGAPGVRSPLDALGAGPCDTLTGQKLSAHTGIDAGGKGSPAWRSASHRWICAAAYLLMTILSSNLNR